MIVAPEAILVRCARPQCDCRETTRSGIDGVCGRCYLRYCRQGSIALFVRPSENEGFAS
jgi:hypothetical protein